MFDGGGVSIDHYIIEVDNKTQFETVGPTYSFDIMYNTTLSVNISAHNCAGYSDKQVLHIDYFKSKPIVIPACGIVTYLPIPQIKQSRAIFLLPQFQSPQLRLLSLQFQL